MELAKSGLAPLHSIIERIFDTELFVGVQVTNTIKLHPIFGDLAGPRYG